MRKNVIQDKSYAFGKSIINLYLALIEQREYVLSKQLLRAGTSVGANVVEATAASSGKDFVYKMALASKEARETRYWLSLIQDTTIVDNDVSTHLEAIEEIIVILTSIVKTSKEKLSQ